MLDRITVLPIGPVDGLYNGPPAAFSSVAVRPETGARYREKPAMPLLPRGYCLDIDGESWTVLRGHVRHEMVPYSDGEIFYWYEYEVVNGKRVLD